jgi:acyl-CoA dehydrogenase
MAEASHSLLLSVLQSPSVEAGARLAGLRLAVRKFIAQEHSQGLWTREPEGWDRWDPSFSRRVGKMGWIGMTLPRRYGGQECSELERYVVLEELVTAGAPMKAHNLADRQIAPIILKFGSEEQRLSYLPRIAAGELSFSVALSEPDAGSDLSAVRTKAVKVAGGWRIDGRKVWTSFAHKAQSVLVFVRTSPRFEADRRAGFSHFLVDLKAPGVTVTPIVNMAGNHDFNEVLFDGVLVPDADLLGNEGEAWEQVTSELMYERYVPERWGVPYDLMVHLVDHLGPSPNSRDAEKAGRLIAHLWTLHRLSVSIAAAIDAGQEPYVEAAIVKDLGATFEQNIPAVVREIISEADRATRVSDERVNATLDRNMYYAPTHTILAGTREIMRGSIARALGLR